MHCKQAKIKQKGRISRDLIALMEKWRHTGFNIFVGQRVFPGNETAIENLALYYPCIFFPGAKDGLKSKVFDALEWQAAF